MVPDASFLMGLCFLNGVESGGLYRDTGDTTVTRRRFVQSTRLCAHSAREGHMWTLAGYVHRVVCDNGAIIKMKRASHSPMNRTAGMPPGLSSRIARNESTRRKKNFFFTIKTDVGTCISSVAVYFFCLFEIPEIYTDLFFDKSRYIPHDAPGWFTRNCKCKFDSGSFYRRTKNKSNAEAVFIILQPTLSLNWFTQYFTLQLPEKKM